MPSCASTRNSCGSTCRTSRSSGSEMLRAASMARRTSSRSISRGRVPEGNAAAAVHAAHMTAGHADHRGLHRNVGHTFGFFHGAANGTHRGIQINDQAFAQSLGFRRAQSEKIHLLVVDFRDQRAGLGAADIQPYDEIYLSCSTLCSCLALPALSRPLRCRAASRCSRSLAANTADRWSAPGRRWPAIAQNFRPACDICAAKSSVAKMNGDRLRIVGPGKPDHHRAKISRVTEIDLADLIG